MGAAGERVEKQLQDWTGAAAVAMLVVLPGVLAWVGCGKAGGRLMEACNFAAAAGAAAAGVQGLALHVLAVWVGIGTLLGG